MNLSEEMIKAIADEEIQRRFIVAFCNKLIEFTDAFTFGAEIIERQQKAIDEIEANKNAQ